MKLSFLTLQAALLVVGQCVVLAADAPDATNDLLDKRDPGTCFRLVKLSAPQEGLGQQLFWRSVEDVVAAETAPVEFRIDDAELIGPQNAAVDQAGPKATSAQIVYPTEAYKTLAAGPHLLQPGNIALQVTGGNPSSKHPAIKIANGRLGREVLIQCAPVRLEVVDASGSPVPTALRVNGGEKSLLRTPATFSSLVIWLPVGCQYSSSLGSFSLAADGTVIAGAGSLPAGVSLTSTGLRKIVPTAQPAARAGANSFVIQIASGPGHSFAVFVPPLTPAGQPLWLALAKGNYEQVIDKPFAVEQFSASWNLDHEAGVVRPARLEAGGAGPGSAGFGDSVVAQAASELRVDPSGLVWMKMPVPQALYGAVAFLLRTQNGSGMQGSTLVANVGHAIEVVPHRWRTAFAETETAVYEVFVAGPFAGGAANVQAQSQVAGSAPIMIGKLDLPAVERQQFDSRVLRLTAGDLPAGQYQLWVEAAGRSTGSNNAFPCSGRVPLQVVAWHSKSPFFSHTMSCCATCWPTDEEGLSRLQAAGLEMATVAGANSLLTAQVPALNPALGDRLEQWDAHLPIEMSLLPTGNDYLLERMLRHQLRLVDLAVVRGANFYNEGLSYHHSYGPSVDRMVRRMQVFTQQTGEYPSFAGINYSWFPALGGYVEGGVPTDPHTADRMRALNDTLTSAGFKPLSPEQSKWLAAHKDSTESADRAQVAQLARQATDYWRAQQDYGFGKHNQLYNAAVHQVRPQTITALFDNAGHDAGKRTRALFNDMSASCYECYTDYGDWPMSCSFAVDWSRGNLPNQPVWLTTNWGSNSTGNVKSLFHAFARGLGGGGMPLQADLDPMEIVRRGTAMKFIAQYGALTHAARPDGRVALLSRTAKQALNSQGMWQLHAMYYHLTRLGFAPVLVADDDVMQTGVPASVKALVLVQEEYPLEPEARSAIERFMAQGGKVLQAGKSAIALPGSIAIDVPVKHLWDFKGFQGAAHAEMWQEFADHWRAPLTAALQKAGLETLAGTDIDRAIALTMNAGPVRYVMVIDDANGSHSNGFQRPIGLPVSLAGSGWLVRDLVKQQTLAAKANGNRTEVSVDLITEPATLLACYPAAPQSITLEMAPQPRLGAALVFNSHVAAKDGSQTLDLGAVPASFSLVGPDGRQRRAWHDAASTAQRVALPALDMPGNWQLVVQELLTGLTATASFVVADSPRQPAALPVGDVHVVDAAHLRGFAERQEEKLVILEPGQQSLLPLAQQFTSSLVAAGVKARLWQVRPEEFDTSPVRWYPTPDDEVRLRDIMAGKLIGYRGSLKAYIDKLKRVHVPELGGYQEIDPRYMVGQDCIVFSGGRLAESLRAVTPWINTPNSPGHGQGRVVVCFSPFMADKQVVAVLANDLTGMGNATEQILATVKDAAAKGTVPKDAVSKDIVPKDAAGKSAPAQQARRATDAAAAETMVAVATKLETRPIESSYRNYEPLQRVKTLLATRAGHAAMLLNGSGDDLALIDDQGRLNATVTLPEAVKPQVQLDDQGNLHLLKQIVLARDPSWHFPSEIQFDALTINPQGQLVAEGPVYQGDAYRLPPDFEGGFRASPDGRTLSSGRLGMLWFGQPGQAGWRQYDDLTQATKRFEVLWPRYPIGGSYSPDSRYLLVSMDSRPPFGGLFSPARQPTSSETILFDLEKNERLWTLHDDQYMQAPYAVQTGFAAIATGGNLTAIAGYDGAIFLVDRAGNILLREQVTTDLNKNSRIGPPDGVGVWMSDRGELAAFGFKSTLLLARGQQLTRLPRAGLTSACVAHDGSLAVLAMSGGRVEAVDGQGTPLWSLDLGGAGCQVAAVGDNQVLIATGNGDLLRVDAAGKQLWSAHVAAAADQGKHPVTAAADKVVLAELPNYREPQTLAYAKDQLTARQVAAWTPRGAGHEAWSRKFYETSGPIELTTAKSGPADGEFFLHLVYRRPSDNRSLQVTLQDKDGKNTFDLDLATPNYRVVDLPLRGASATATVTSDGPVEIADCSLWSCQWPSGNLAYIKPAGSSLEKIAKPKVDNLVDDIAAELEAKPQVSLGLMKDCKIYFPNPDPDQVAGPYLRAPLDPTQMVDGKRFEQGKLAAWAGQNPMQPPGRGAFVTIDFSQAGAPRVLATYDRVLRQSQVCASLVVFTTEELNPLTSGKVVAAACDNDQFWRLFPLPKLPPQVLGIQAFSGSNKQIGLSEVEAYK